jgi:Cys-tRNA synthase (O-phospho-L-seryl-tRNA:Cys-tRNA synthase)
MYNRHWAIPSLIVLLIVAYTVCSFCVTGYYEWIPIPILARKYVWAAVSLFLTFELVRVGGGAETDASRPV